MEKTNTLIEQNDVLMVAEALARKRSRKSISIDKHLIKQAKYFSPVYRPFIYQVIKNSSLRINDSYKESYITAYGEDVDTPKLTKKQTNRIFANFSNLTSLPHELGHAVDFWFGHAQTLSSHVVLANGQTLQDIFDQEFASKQVEIYQTVMDEYKTLINTNINDQAYDLLMNNMSLYKKLCKTRVNLKHKETVKERRKMQAQLYASGFVETYYHLAERQYYSILNKKYSLILDALSSKYDFNGLLLDHHEFSYYKRSSRRPVQEFFANLFRAKVTSKRYQFENIVKFLPRSFAAFEELFLIFYNHIQANKKFTDVEIRKDISNEQL